MERYAPSSAHDAIGRPGVALCSDSRYVKIRAGSDPLYSGSLRAILFKPYKYLSTNKCQKFFLDKKKLQILYINIYTKKYYIILLTVIWFIQV